MIQLDQKSFGNRTLFYIGDEHVGTMIVQEKAKKGTQSGEVWWCAPGCGGHVGSAAEAIRAIMAALEK